MASSAFDRSPSKAHTAWYAVHAVAGIRVRTSAGAFGATGTAARPLRFGERLVLGDEAGERLGLEDREELDATCLAPSVPGPKERHQAGPAPLAPVNAVVRQDLEQDVEVADRAEPCPDHAEVAHVAATRLALEPVTKHAPGGTHPARRDAHRVDFLGVLARDHARHAGEHPREVEAQDLASGLGPRVVAKDAGRPADSQASDDPERRFLAGETAAIGPAGRVFVRLRPGRPGIGRAFEGSGRLGHRDTGTSGTDSRRSGLRIRILLPTPRSWRAAASLPRRRRQRRVLRDG